MTAPSTAVSHRRCYMGDHNTHLFLSLAEKERRRRTTANPSWQNNSWSWRNNTVKKEKEVYDVRRVSKRNTHCDHTHTHTNITTQHSYTTKARPDVFVTEAHR